MKYKPLSIYLLSMFFVAVAIGMPLQIMFLYQHSILEWGSIVSKLTPLNWMISLTCLVAAWLTFTVSSFSWVVIPFLCIEVLQNNILVAEVGTDYTPFEAGLASGAFLICAVTPLLLRANRLIFSNPSLRWWLTPIRKRISLPVSMNLSKLRGNVFVDMKSKTFDVSETGAFVVFETFENSKTLPEIGSRFSIMLGKTPIQCEAEVVRVHADQDETPYPTGIGIRFMNLTSEGKLKLREWVHDSSYARV